MPQQVLAAAWPTDAMGYRGLFFVLAFLGREIIGSASTLSGFPVKFFWVWAMTPLTGGCCGSAHGRHGL
jgi:hypothetical protein